MHFQLALHRYTPYNLILPPNIHFAYRSIPQFKCPFFLFNHFLQKYLFPKNTPL